MKKYVWTFFIALVFLPFGLGSVSARSIDLNNHAYAHTNKSGITMLSDKFGSTVFNADAANNNGMFVTVYFRSFQGLGGDKLYIVYPDNTKQLVTEPQNDLKKKSKSLSFMLEKTSQNETLIQLDHLVVDDPDYPDYLSYYYQSAPVSFGSLGKGSEGTSGGSTGGGSTGGGSTGGGSTGGGSTGGGSTGSGSSPGTGSVGCICADLCESLPSMLNGIRGDLDGISSALSPIHSDLQSIDHQLDAVRAALNQIDSNTAPLHGDLEKIDGSLSRIDDKLSRINNNDVSSLHDDLQQIKTQFEPIKSFGIRDSVGLPDYGKPDDIGHKYEPKQGMFKDNGSAPEPDAMPIAPDPKNWKYNGMELKPKEQLNQTPELEKDVEMQPDKEMVSDPVLQQDKPLQQDSPLKQDAPLQQQIKDYPLIWKSTDRW